VRIGVLTTSYPRDDDDPAGSFVAGFARWLARGAQVEVMCAGAGQPLFYGGGAPQALRQGGARAWLRACAFTARLYGEAAKRAARWDALVSHWLVPSGAAGALLSRGRPHLAIAHGSDARLVAALPGGPAFARILSRRADLVYVAGALALPGAEGRVAPMGIDVARVSGGDRASARARLGLHGFTVLFLGRLSPEKAPERAIAALPDDATLLVAGDGPLRDALPASPRVRLLGEVRGEAKRDLLAAADALIVPSREEGAPTVVLEALAAGLPIVATRAGGIPELLESGALGLLCDHDPAALRRALTALKHDPGLARAFAERGRIAARAHDWSAAGPRLAGDLVRQDAAPGSGSLSVVSV
jgi:glycosyltransferase involved in cell wall biosynthesis